MGARIWDISERMSERTAVFPGDTPFSRQWVMRMADGGSCNVSSMTMSVHCGTHTDAPLHYDDAGPGMADVPLDAYLGRARVLAVDGEGDPQVVSAAALRGRVDGCERVLLRTAMQHDGTRFDPGFTALGPAAAEVLVAAGVRLIGIDTPSMDHAASQDLAAHHVLYRGGIALLENLDLTDVPEGDYELIALPLKIDGSDSSPVRAVLRELEQA